MRKSITMLFITLSLLAGRASAQANLTETETRWLKAGSAVLNYARQLKLPFDIIVQPQAQPGDVPFAMGFDGGRCKLVLSMRGNPQAEAVLDEVPAAQRGLMIEAMTAHEMAHCWRYAHGDWHLLPAGLVEVGWESASDPALLWQAKAQRESRREEGFADLVALAWIWLRHPLQYGHVYAWLERVRHEQPAAGASHDTLVWRRLARDGAVFASEGTSYGSPFERVGALWNEGLTSTE
jgi:hypothetical protein